MRIVITGGAGFLGYHLAPYCAAERGDARGGRRRPRRPGGVPRRDGAAPGGRARPRRRRPRPARRRRRRPAGRRRPRRRRPAPLVAGGHPQHQRGGDAHRAPGGPRRRGARGRSSSPPPPSTASRRSTPWRRTTPWWASAPTGRARSPPSGSAPSSAPEGYCVPVLRPKTFLGTGRLGVFQILYDWVHAGKRIPVLGSGRNRYQLLEVDDLCAALWLAATAPPALANATFNVGAARFGTVAEDVGALCAHAASGARVFPVPAAPGQAGPAGPGGGAPLAPLPLGLRHGRPRLLRLHRPPPEGAGLAPPLQQRRGPDPGLRLVPRSTGTPSPAPGAAPRPPASPTAWPGTRAPSSCSSGGCSRTPRADLRAAPARAPGRQPVQGRPALPHRALQGQPLPAPAPCSTPPCAGASPASPSPTTTPSAGPSRRWPSWSASRSAIPGLTILPGEEVKTREGELIALFIRETIPPRLTPEETIARIRDQGGPGARPPPLRPRPRLPPAGRGPRPGGAPGGRDRGLQRPHHHRRGQPPGASPSPAGTACSRPPAATPTSPGRWATPTSSWMSPRRPPPRPSSTSSAGARLWGSPTTPVAHAFSTLARLRKRFGLAPTVQL